MGRPGCRGTMPRQKPGHVKVTPISELEAPVVEETGIALSDSPATISRECCCSRKAVTERASGTIVLRCPECGLIRDIWRGARRLAAGSYCPWCGLEDLTLPLPQEGSCGHPDCRAKQKAHRERT